jgi:hypothetical protein
VVENQELGYGERLRTLEVGAERELAEPLRAQVPGEVQLLLDMLFDLRTALGVELPQYEQDLAIALLPQLDTSRSRKRDR